MEPVRSSAKERRLRQKRSDARIRLRLAADAVLLGEHHASAVPQKAASPGLRGDRVVHLLEQLVAQQCALFTVFASMSGWQAGSVAPSGFSANCGECGDYGIGSADVPAATEQAEGEEAPESYTGNASPSNVDSGLMQPEEIAGVDPVVFARSHRFFGSADAHREAFDDVAHNLQHILSDLPCSLWAKDALLDLDVFHEQVFCSLSPFQVIPGFQKRWKLVAIHGLGCAPDCRTHEDLLAHLLQEPNGVRLSGLSFGSLYAVALFTFAGFPGQYDLESYVGLLRMVPGGLQSSSSSSLSVH